MMMIRSYSQSADTTLSERKKKKLQKRIERLQMNLRHERKNYKLYLELGDLYALMEELKDAEKHYMTAIDLLHQGDIDEKARKQIIVLYGKILNLDPNNHDAYTQLGQEYVAAGQKEKASRFLLSSGKKAFENGDYELALQCYEQVIDLGKSNPYIIERCTEIFLKLDRKGDAIENYVKIGDMYAREEKAVEALEYYKKASALDPDSPDLTLKVARMYYTLEWTENAAAEMIKIAEYHEQQQNFSEALKYYQHSLSLDRENDRALAGKLRITASYSANIPENVVADEQGKSQEDILEELDLIEEALKTQNFSKTTEEKREADLEAELVPEAEAPVPVDLNPAESEAQTNEALANNVIDASDIFSNGASAAKSPQKDGEEREVREEQAATSAEEEDFFEMDLRDSQSSEDGADTQQEEPKHETVAWQDRLLDLNLEEDFVLMTGLDDQNDAPSTVPLFSDEGPQAATEESEGGSPEALASEAPSLEAENEDASGKADIAPDAEYSETDAELFEPLDISASAEESDEAEDVFEPAELQTEAVTETADENPFEDVLFEDLPEEEHDEETKAFSFVSVPEKDEHPGEVEEGGVSLEANHDSDMASREEEDAEKLISETLRFATDESLEASEHAAEESEVEDIIHSSDAEAVEENAPEEVVAEPETQESDMAGLREPGDVVDMPATFTPIKKPEKRPREKFSGTGPELEQKLEDLEKQLENTEEEKYFLQEQFTAQISKLKSQEALIKREFERVRQDKDDLQHRLEEVTSIYEASRQKGEEHDEARYEAIVNKIQRKKQALQQHVNKLLKQREQNGRLLAEELKSLGSTKLRLQNNLEYIQQVKTRVEQKIQTDLRQAQEEIQRLSSQAMELESELNSKQQSEQHLHDQFDKLQKEKDTLQDQFTETISALTEENEKIGEQLKEISKEKLETEHLLKKKFKVLHLSYQRLKAEFKSSVHSKEMELNRTAQRLSQFADEYVKLETTLKEIRKERDKLERMLAQETATRERLEDNLTDIESQVDSLEAQGSELLEQLEEELDHQLKIKQDTSDEFQVSLGELEQLLAMQEKEIQSLEVL